MATAKKTPAFKATVAKTIADAKAKAQIALDKSGKVAGEVGDFTKGNVTAVVESGKILAAGVQELGRDCVEDTKGAFETVTGDMKKLAAIKSPTELFQLQGELMRRNFDSAVAYGSKSSEKVVKLANESFAPISTRVSLAVDKISKIA